MALSAEQQRTWKLLEGRWEKLGFENLDDIEKEAIALFWLDGEVDNGGLHQYFLNSSGDMAPYAVAGLERLNAKEALALLKSAMKKLKRGPYPTDQEERYDLLDAFGDDDPFDAETRALTRLADTYFNHAVDALAAAYAKRGRRA